MQKLSQDQLIELYQAFPSQFKSVVLGTADRHSQPNASYAPCVVDENRNIYIFVSGLSAHTQNMTDTGTASALFIQDEAQSPQMFARRRLSYSCTAILVDRQSDRWQSIAQQFESRFGNIIEVMKGLADFRIFQLSPQSGRFVIGFGAAYNVDPDDLSKLIHKGES